MTAVGNGGKKNVKKGMNAVQRGDYNMIQRQV
jgi:hypothetical protein